MGGVNQILLRFVDYGTLASSLLVIQLYLICLNNVFNSSEMKYRKWKSTPERKVLTQACLCMLAKSLKTICFTWCLCLIQGKWRENCYYPQKLMTLFHSHLFLPKYLKSSYPDASRLSNANGKEINMNNYKHLSGISECST